MVSGHIDATILANIDGNTQNQTVLDPVKIKAFYDEIASKNDGNYDFFLADYNAAIGLSRQAMINGNFDVWQRGTSAAYVENFVQYLADRWAFFEFKDTAVPPAITYSRQNVNPGDIPGAYYYCRANFGGSFTFSTAAQHFLKQPIEYGTRFLCGGGKSISINFWAKSDIAGKKLGITAFQNYGSGGTPSANENLPGAAITLSTTWTKYTVTISTNTLVGKTFGTNNDDYLDIRFYYGWGTSIASRFNTAAAENVSAAGNIDIAQVQVNAGDQALPFQPKSFVEELALCQRFCQVISSNATNAIVGNGTAASTTQALIHHTFNVQMRVPPTLVATATDWQLADSANAPTNLTTIALFSSQNSEFSTAISAGVASGLTQYRPYILWANATSKRIIFDAEL